MGVSLIGPALGLAGQLFGSSEQSNAAQNATDAQTAAAQAAIAEQQREFNTTQSNEAPWIHAGTGALNQLHQLNSGNYSSFKQSPDYQWTLQQGIGALDKSAAAKGNLGAGGYGEDLTNYAQGLASTQYGNYYNRIASLAGLGQTAVGQQGQLGQAAAQNIGNQYTNLGNAQASGYTAQGNTWANFGNQAGQAFGNYFSGSNPFGSNSSGYNAPLNFNSSNTGTNPNIPAGWF